VAEQRILLAVMTLPWTGMSTQKFGFYWTHELARPYLVMQFVDVVLFAVILTLIEVTRGRRAASSARSSFGAFAEDFARARAARAVTPEAIEMEEAVKAPGADFVVRVIDCSRLFFNTANEPVPAVNSVSLGIREGSVFALLGNNGMGKTTLLKMIAGQLPASAGTVEILGRDIGDGIDPSSLAFCPQFNEHLCRDLTPREHFKLYAWIHKLPINDALVEGERLLEALGLSPFADKPVRELSGGNQRKMAVGLSFFGPASIVLLDEPTSSLDPVARKNVHELINQFRGAKTFLLCTHLLSEAEALCDQLSIMVKGGLYTCGAPQHLQEKFAKQFRIDLSLLDRPDAASKCSAFMSARLPSARVTQRSPSARAYSVPSEETTITELFEVMGAGATGDNGYRRYTCSSSSLEHVFMQIVRASELASSSETLEI
jgi:ABC-type multidrug transport system ATPase subunit